MKKAVPDQVKISYALTFIPAVIFILWGVYAAVFGYNYNFIESLGNSDLHYGMDGVSEMLDAAGILFMFTPAWWIAFLMWAVLNIYMVIKLASSQSGKGFEMTQKKQDIFTILVILMDIMFLGGFVRVV